LERIRDIKMMKLVAFVCLCVAVAGASNTTKCSNEENPCGHNGWCNNDGVCKCPLGVIGDMCQTKVQDNYMSCSSRPCSHGRVPMKCYDVACDGGRSSCIKCVPKSASNSTKCSNKENPCGHNGWCNDDGVCKCPLGVIGDMCQTKVEDNYMSCSSRPCSHGRVPMKCYDVACASGRSSCIKCVSKSASNSTKCSNDENPCGHNGWCNDDGVCKCPLGVTGDMCQTKVEDRYMSCSSNPCSRRSGPPMKCYDVACFWGRSSCVKCVPKTHEDTEDKAAVDPANYLQQYGYYNPNAFDGSGDMKSAVEAFQKTYDLPVTGEMDDATNKLMAAPRCGNPDTRRNGYYVTKGKWRYQTLTYNFYTSGIPSDLQKAIHDAFRQWSKYVPLTFRKVSGRSHLRIYYENASGRNANAWAFAYFPTHGGIYINKRRGPWYYQKLYEIGTHEIGHALGLDHTNVRGAMMYPYWNRNGDYRMNRDDVNGMQRLYGRNSGK